MRTLPSIPGGHGGSHAVCALPSWCSWQEEDAANPFTATSIGHLTLGSSSSSILTCSFKRLRGTLLWIPRLGVRGHECQQLTEKASSLVVANMALSVLYVCSQASEAGTEATPSREGCVG